MQSKTATQTRQRHAATSNKSVTKVVESSERAPSEKPAFTVGDLRNAIPKHCFDRPLWKSFGYLAVDLVACAALFYLSTHITTFASDAKLGSSVGPWVRAALWCAYWWVQGNVMTGLWVIGHECGHGGFAASSTLSNVVGLIVHSCLLVPYFAWQISHRRHHSNTGSIEHDEVFVPDLNPALVSDGRGGYVINPSLVHHDDDGVIPTIVSTLRRMFFIVVMLTLGWPGYLIANMSGNKTYDPKTWVSHFHPSSPIFNTGSEDKDAKNEKLIIISDVALIIVVAGLVKLSMMYSFASVFFYYGVPYLITNMFLVLITYLQHTDINLPHYTSGEWDWLRGALATVDRDFGLSNYFHHHIADTHICHHLFSALPHYHAEEATEALKPILGKYYRMDRTPIVKALWNSFSVCNYVSPDPQRSGVWWF